MNDSLAKRNAKVGNSAIRAALESIEQERAKVMTGQVQNVLKEKESIEETITILETRKLICEARMDALKAGDFTTDRHGNIRYNNPDLNEWPQTLAQALEWQALRA